MKAYLSSIQNSEAYKASKLPDSTWEGKHLTEASMDKALGLFEIFLKITNVKGEMLDMEFVESVITCAREFMPDLTKFDTEFELATRNPATSAHYANQMESIKAKRAHMFNDVLSKVNMVEASVEAVGNNDDLAFVVAGAKPTGIEVNTVKKLKKEEDKDL